MSNRFENKDAQKSISRMNDDLKLEKGTKNAVEAVLVGTIAEGRMADATTIATLLGKTTPMSNLNDKLDMLIDRVNRQPVVEPQVVQDEPVVSLQQQVEELTTIVMGLANNKKTKK